MNDIGKIGQDPIEEQLEILRTNLEKEKSTFNHSFATMKPMEVYEQHYKIGFYEEYYQMLMTDFMEENIEDVKEIAWFSNVEYPLALLYEMWIGCSEAAFSHSWDDMLDWIKDMANEVGKA